PTPTQPLDIYHRPPGPLPPPGYRPPPGVVKGPLRTRLSIIGGLLISNDEGRRWFNDTYTYKLPPRHSVDRTVNMRLEPLLFEKDLDVYGICTAPRRLESEISDFLVITFVQHGPFTHDGPEAYEEVYDENRKPIPGVKEEKIKEQLKEYFGM
ncbi:hypothetical protein H0H93_007603, partial [Arthromyces matolae]